MNIFHIGEIFQNFEEYTEFISIKKLFQKQYQVCQKI